jgi:hypothetical protein
MEYTSKTKWREFHYPKPLKVKDKNPITYKLIDVFNNSIIVIGSYALCVYKQKQITTKTKITKL